MHSLSIDANLVMHAASYFAKTPIPSCFIRCTCVLHWCIGVQAAADVQLDLCTPEQGAEHTGACESCFHAAFWLSGPLKCPLVVLEELKNGFPSQKKLL